MNRFIFAGITAAFAIGCSVQASPPPPPDDGVVVLDWTVEGSTDPNACADNGATTIDILVTYQDGTSAGDFQDACSAFSTRFSLAPGRYTADVVMLDARGNIVTTHLAVNPFTISGDDSLDLPIDFPADSFD